MNALHFLYKYMYRRRRVLVGGTIMNLSIKFLLYNNILFLEYIPNIPNGINRHIYNLLNFRKIYN